MHTFIIINVNSDRVATYKLYSQSNLPSQFEGVSRDALWYAIPGTDFIMPADENWNGKDLMVMSRLQTGCLDAYMYLFEVNNVVDPIVQRVKSGNTH